MRVKTEGQFKERRSAETSEAWKREQEKVAAERELRRAMYNDSIDELEQAIQRGTRIPADANIFHLVEEARTALTAAKVKVNAISDLKQFQAEAENELLWATKELKIEVLVAAVERGENWGASASLLEEARTAIPAALAKAKVAK